MGSDRGVWRFLERGRQILCADARRRRFPLRQRYTGPTWMALSPALHQWVDALAVSSGDLYAGGYFNKADGSPANYIAKWNGSNWISLGSGLNSIVNALTASGTDLYVGGQFTTAGGQLSAYIARAYLPPLPTLSMLYSGTNATVAWPSADTSGFALEEANTLAGSINWLPNLAAVVDDGTNNSVTIPTSNNAQFFRLRRP